MEATYIGNGGIRKGQIFILNMQGGLGFAHMASELGDTPRIGGRLKMVNFALIVFS
jgi:hypothetical protein